MIQATRSPGSTLKPFIYALGFSQHIIAPLTIIKDTESVFENYKPNNFNKKFNGEVSIAYALEHSLNIPAVKVLQRVGVNNFITLLNSISQVKIPKNRASLSVALGGLGVNMIELAKYYSALANDGKYRALSYFKNSPKKEIKFLDKIASREVNSILQNVKPPDGFVNQGQKIAFKTGTSYGFRDFWTVAYSKDYTVVLLVAKPNGKPMQKGSGRENAAPLAFEIMGIIDSIYGLKGWGYKSSTYLSPPPRVLQYFDKQEKDITTNKFTFAYPKKGSRYRSSNCKDVKVKALLKNGKAPYSWYIDGILLSSNSKKIAKYFDSGGHTITAISASGDIISRNIWVDKPDCIK
jgi:membrane carboxypeptidase/penicillin-binding protein PbpC